HSDDVAKVASSDLTLVAIDGGDERADISYDELVDSCSPAPPAPFARGAGSARIVIHTSGTTGKPKGASRDTSAAGIGAIANIIGRVPYRRDDIVFCPAPLFHSFGLATFAFGTVLGATLVLPDRFDPEDSLRWIDERKATAASFVPVMIRRLVSLDDAIKQRYDVSSLRIVLASGSVLTEDLRAAARDLLGDVLYDLYGSTEVGWISIATPEDMRTRPGTVGHPVDGIDVAIFGPDGDRLPPGQPGELYIKSDVHFEGYTSGETKDEREGYMSVGDLGYMDDDGYLYVSSRSDDMVIIGGENVYPVEIEQVIESVPGVEEVTVLGMEDEEYGSVLAAFAVGSASAEAIRAACEAQLASFKVPRRIEVLPELPRTSTGKVVKRELLAQLQETAT
ncbi:MAG: AMP-binding protein, partial [Actinomycetota bacterium]|nr:AMP-binding protein [Actinomycetota bacterium]